MQRKGPGTLDPRPLGLGPWPLDPRGLGMLRTLGLHGAWGPARAHGPMGLGPGPIGPWPMVPWADGPMDPWFEDASKSFKSQK